MAMKTLEQFVVLLYDRTSDIMNINDSRKYLFTQKTGALKTYHQLKKCSNNTSNELGTSLFAGRRP